MLILVTIKAGSAAKIKYLYFTAYVLVISAEGEIARMRSLVYYRSSKVRFFTVSNIDLQPFRSEKIS